MYVTAYPTREELLDGVKYGNVTVNEKFAENEEKILAAFARKLKKIDIKNIELFMGNFVKADYKWKIDTSSHVRYDWNGEQKNENSILLWWISLFL